jgi:P-type Mg2+ transporter
MALATPFLPFLPLLAKQILLNNSLADLPSIAISTDNVDAAQTASAQHWQVRDIRLFMIVFGLISSAFDMVTFAVLLLGFRTGEATFQTAWFVVSLLTQLAVVMVLRTRGPALASRPSRLLLWTTIVIGALALVIPYAGPLAVWFGFVPLPAALLAVLPAIAATYVVAVELAKRRFYRSARGPTEPAP